MIHLDNRFKFEAWRFPCKEIGVKIQEVEMAGSWDTRAVIHLVWEGNDDLIALAQTVDILRHKGYKNLELRIPYFPYGRQDRRCSDGEAAALKVFGTIINSLKFDKVTTWDAHSYVLEAVVDNLEVIEQYKGVVQVKNTTDIYVAPDAGAEKKIFKIPAVAMGRVPAICATKARDEKGNITSVQVPENPDIRGKKAMVVDDICDGGATFLGLGAVLRQREPKELNLYVTHGMFTKGYDALMGTYDNIYMAHRSPIAPTIPERFKDRITLV